MSAGRYRKLLFILLFLWFLVNLLQAIFTEILSDEAYYGLYAKYLSWGYFDHPPLVALLVKISSLFFTGNLGIRFMTILMQLGTILLTLRIIDEKDPDKDKVYSFFIIAGSICMFSAYGFVTTPDVPLLFFTAFFLYSYKEYLVDKKWKNVILLSLSMAGLVYSKYQAVLVIGFVILSNIKLLKMYRFWLAGIFALILLSPHIWWQIANDFPTLQYHLVDRSEGFKWLFLLEYLPNQMAVFNPFILGAVIYILVKFKPDGQFSRSLYFSIIGFIGFFWLTAFRGHVEPHWTIACSVPMIILLYNNSVVNPKLFRFLRKTVLPSIFILIMIRILLISHLPIVDYLGFNGKKKNYKRIESLAKDLPVVFSESFQDASLYSFFTGKEAMVISSLYSRQSQFDIWQFEKKYNNKPAYICEYTDEEPIINERKGSITKRFKTDSLQTINRIRIAINSQIKILHAGDSINLKLTLYCPYEYDIDFNHKRFPVKIYITFLAGEKVYLINSKLQEPVSVIHRGETITSTLRAIVPDIPPGKYQFGISLDNSLGPAFNSSFSRVKII
jgi:hypothetical protein